MSRKRVLLVVVGLVVVGLVVVGLAVALSERAGPRLAPRRLNTLGAELLHLDAGKIVRRGPSAVWVLRLSGPVELVPHHFEAAGLVEPQPIEAWADHLGASVVFNAGQFDEKLDHLGWLKSDGVWINDRQHGAYKGLLVSGPLEGAAWSGVVDLEHTNPRIVERYRHVVQSMMLLDESGNIRVRDSDLTACRTVVAQDGEGRVLIMVTEGAMTLGDLARWLPSTGLGIVRAMNLDGGIESQLAVRTPELEFTVYGQYGTGTTVFPSGAGRIRYPLPAVVAVHPIVGEP
jgi:hypothetical protein